MDIVLDGVGKVSCSPEEFLTLKKLGVFDHAESGQPASTSSESIHRNPASESITTHDRTAQGAGEIGADLFFEDVSSAMARILLVYLENHGTVTQRQLLATTGLTGPSLRRPNGALNERIRRATLGRITHFYTVDEPNRINDLTDRVFRVNKEALAFILRYEARIKKLAAS